MTSGNLWNYYRNEVNDDANENNDDNYSINSNKTITSSSFEYRIKIIWSTPDDDNTLDAELLFH